jgi:antitoxin component YwqK of YwqJK toxin-antitoxin module
MRFHYYIGFILFFVLLSGKSYCQVEDKKFDSDTVPTITFESDTVEEQPKKKKKPKKKVFYGMKCRRGFTRKGTGSKEVVENFFFLKHYKEPNPYAKRIFVFDVRKQQIVEVPEINKKDVQFYKILHGPYKKSMGGSVIEEGVFYVGTKHARWEKYAPKKTEKFIEEEISYNILIDKEKYYKGWPKESRITFYDGAQTKIKEVIPYEYGKIDGDYFYFKENGEVLIQGKYIDGKKAGIWVEYDTNKNKKIREIQYPASPYTEDQFESYVLTEWNENGQMIIQKGQKIEPGKKGADPIKERYKRNKK